MATSLTPYNSTPNSHFLMSHFSILRIHVPVSPFRRRHFRVTSQRAVRELQEHEAAVKDNDLPTALRKCNATNAVERKQKKHIC